jgi:hypothetical protein
MSTGAGGTRANEIDSHSAVRAVPACNNAAGAAPGLQGKA